ncbi:MAG: UTRA domain-containing protein [Xanthobacteraceae bacterium]|nr:UTRA domain-containing protein [Xanthobacteraceae bacterium]
MDLCDGTRRDSGNEQPICISRLFINRVFTGIESKLREGKMAMYALIEKEYKISIRRVGQELQGIAPGLNDAGNLGTTTGAPSLRIVRRYCDSKRRLIDVADNIHPSNRFTYRTQLKK